MALTNKLKQILDQPVFEWLRFSPLATVSLSGLCAPDDTLGRYLYYINTSFFRYDTYSDSWQTLAYPNITPATALSLKYSKYGGSRGTVISATTTSSSSSSSGITTIQLAGMKQNLLVGQTILIIAGTGSGQSSTIASVTDAVVADNGVVTSAAAASITDTTKKWQFNQWVGYQVRIVYSTGASQIRKVLYNDQTNLYFYDINYQQIDPWNNTGFSAVAPYAVPVSTAGSQSFYVIESSTVTLATPFSVNPDNTSRYKIFSQSMWLLSSQASAPWSSLQHYDVLSDIWYTRTALGGHLNAALGTDLALERTGDESGVVVSGTSTGSNAARTLINSGASYTVDRYANYQLRITGGTGNGQRRRIVGNNATTFWIERNWDVTPDSTSTYAVYGDLDKLWLVGNASSAIWQYCVDADQWVSGPMYDFGICRNQSAWLTGATGSTPQFESVGLTSIVRTTTGILTVAVNAAGSNYVVGDLVTCSTGGTLGTAFVTAVNGTGGVTALQLASSGSGYTAGSSATTGGTGTSLTITITVGITALVTTAINHFFQPGQSVTLAGNATDTTFNAAFTILGVGSITTFSIACSSSSASPTAANSQSTTVLVDAQKNWITNEHVGRVLVLNTAGPSPTTQLRRITSNTANTITVTTAITAGVNGTSRYIIEDINNFGTSQLYRAPSRQRDGWATSGSATTLVDTSKNWANGQWTACRVRIISGTGIGNEAAITGNTATTLTVASWPNATPDTTSKYQIMDTFGIATSGSSGVITDNAKNLVVNALSGKRCRIIAGTLAGTEAAVTSNTATTITTAVGTPDSTSVYEIYEIPAKSTGINLTWVYGVTNTNNTGKWLISARGGGSNVFDIYDITTGKWDLSPFIQPQTEIMNTGSMYTYDGSNAFYFTNSATGRIYLLNLNTFNVDACTTIPYGMSTAILGNRFEMMSTSDGLQYLYIMRHTGQEFWRVLKFW